MVRSVLDQRGGGADPEMGLISTLLKFPDRKGYYLRNPILICHSRVMMSVSGSKSVDHPTLNQNLIY